MSMSAYGELIELNLGLQHEPPYSFTQGEASGKGVVVDILKRVSQDIGFKVNIVPCNLPRCLKLAREGKIDVMGNLIKTDKRNQFLDFIEPAYMVLDSSYVFYALRRNNFIINQYEQLQSMRISIVRDAVYFKRFDQDQSLNKVEVISEEKAIEMLVKGRVDLVVAVEDTTEHALVFNNQPREKLQKLGFRHTDHILGYMAFSRSFTNVQLLKKIKATMRKLQNNGVLTDIVSAYNLPAISKQSK